MSLLFVYGTLMPGRVRWPLLEPWTVPVLPVRAQVNGHLIDTGFGWPAALFDTETPNTVPGLAIGLRPSTETECLALLDQVEGVAAGLFDRVAITTTGGDRCWAYEWLDPTRDFLEIDSWDRP